MWRRLAHVVWLIAAYQTIGEVGERVAESGGTLVRLYNLVKGRTPRACTSQRSRGGPGEGTVVVVVWITSDVPGRVRGRQ